MDSRTTAPVSDSEIGLTVTPMPNNPDVFWLMDRCTRYVDWQVYADWLMVHDFCLPAETLRANLVAG